ncbi:MAG TPA: bifunctional glutamate N-acetyltransferase/amino-acid acetyltransferase ArgJ [Clostridia bacterium]|nr:bifunctional glutamate N-acetyltransferase/amino-acid acetyltransferase ArgJ [Clostridia bacterium]
MSHLETIGGGVTGPLGFQAAGVEAGIKTTAKMDLALVFSPEPCEAAGVFTRNKVKAAPLLLDREHLEKARPRALVINSGNANACTGEQALVDARTMARAAALELGLETEEVLVASTGVIGVPLPVEKIQRGIKLAAQELSREGGDRAARAIMTTDLRPKEAAVSFLLEGQKVTIGAMAKGSGMIHPNLATMLAFITTDASVEKQALEIALREAVDASFNMLTVDGDTSTNDLVLLLANGAAGNLQLRYNSPDFTIFQGALTHICTLLAKEIARDGEGATKLLEVRVKNARSLQDARLAARAVAGSSLVKTALFGEDPNWGRILCAAGYSGADFNPATVDIFLTSAGGRIQTAAAGTGLAFDEAKAALILNEKEITFEIDFRDGEYEAAAWGCDFSYDYVKINADYRT